MIENTLHIGNYQYLMQLYTHEDFGLLESESRNFLMIRNFNMMNNIVNDTHVMLIEKSAWLNLCKEIEENKENYLNGFDKALSVVFPIQTTELTGYSTIYSEFNINLVRESLYKIDDDGNFIYGNDIYPIFDHNGQETKIRCNKLRLYHPTTKSSLQSIITIDNHINGIHWYYLCNTLDKFPHNSKTEIRKNNNIYSEYIEILIPDIDFLFSKKDFALHKKENLFEQQKIQTRKRDLSDIEESNQQDIFEEKEIYNAYFDEKLSTIVSSKNNSYINKIVVDDVERFYNVEISINDDIAQYQNVEGTFYFSIGNENPLINNNIEIVFNPQSNIKSFNGSNDLFKYIKNNSLPIEEESEGEKYILLPSIFKDNIIIRNVLNLKFANNYIPSSSDDLPIFEILSDIVNGYDKVNISGINGQYTVYKTRPIAKKIKFHDKREKVSTLKYFYIGPGVKSQNNLMDYFVSSYESPITKTRGSSYNFDLLESEQTKTFYNINSLFSNSIDTTEFTYNYEEYEINKHINKIYLLFPSSLEEELIISDNRYIDGSSNIEFEVNYNYEYKNIKLSNLESDLEYTLISIDDVAGKTIRIYNLFRKKSSDSNNIKINDIDVIVDYDNEYNINNYIDLQHQMVPVSLLLQPYTITDDIDPTLNDVKQVKLYLKDNKSIENNYIMTPFNVSLYPYSYIDQNTGQYIYDDTLSLANVVYNIDCKFDLNATFGFNEESHKASIIAKFNYPYKKFFLDQTENNSQLALQHAYKYYNNIDTDEYRYFWVNLLIQNYDEDDTKIVKLISDYNNLYYTKDIDDNNKYYILMYEHKYEGFVISKITYELLSDRKKKEYKEKKVYNLYKDNEEIDNISTKEKLKRLIDINYDNIWNDIRDWEVEEEYQTNMDFFGFRIQIATDLNYKNIIYNQTYSIDMDQLDDFSFELNNIFDSWLQLPDALICRIMFIDHVINKVIMANNVIITKEYFKYLINENNIYYIKKLNDYNNSMKEINIDSQIDYGEIDVTINEINSIFPDENNTIRKHLLNICEQLKEKYQPFNFINNINCIVNKKSDNQEVVQNHNNYDPRIIYRPIYFRTESLQNIRLRSDVIQNIGINLSKYMTKVETFKLIIDNLVFIESGRNESYVIFNINAASISNANGTYNITNQDDEYISSGNWQKY